MFCANGLGPPPKGADLYTAAYRLRHHRSVAVLIKMKDTPLKFQWPGQTSSRTGLHQYHLLIVTGRIPATAGLMAKFYSSPPAISNGKLLWLVIVGVLCAAISVFLLFQGDPGHVFQGGGSAGNKNLSRFRVS